MTLTLSIKVGLNLEPHRVSAYLIVTAHYEHHFAPCPKRTLGPPTVNAMRRTFGTAGHYWSDIRSESMPRSHHHPFHFLDWCHRIAWTNSYFFGGGALSDPLPASRVWSCPRARYTMPRSSWLQTAHAEHHSSSSTSSMVARSRGSTFNILPMMCLLSRGRMRSSRQGPLITSCLSDCDSE